MGTVSGGNIKKVAACVIQGPTYFLIVRSSAVSFLLREDEGSTVSLSRFDMVSPRFSSFPLCSAMSLVELRMMLVNLPTSCHKSVAESTQESNRKLSLPKFRVTPLALIEVQV